MIKLRGEAKVSEWGFVDRVCGQMWTFNVENNLRILVHFNDLAEEWRQHFTSCIVSSYSIVEYHRAIVILETVGGFEPPFFPGFVTAWSHPFWANSPLVPSLTSFPSLPPFYHLLPCSAGKWSPSQARRLSSTVSFPRGVYDEAPAARAFLGRKCVGW